MEEQKPVLSLGLPKKNDPNDIQFFRELRLGVRSLEEKKTTSLLIQIEIDRIKDHIKQHPEQYFNFGFTFNDFKAFLMKTMYCRAVRSFVEKKRIQRIDEYNSQNKNIYQAFQGTQ